MKWKSNSYVSVRNAYTKLKERIEVHPRLEYIAVLESYGRVLYNDVISRADIPPCPSSHMDGIAVLANDIKLSSNSNPTKLNIVGNVGLGKVPKKALHSGQACRIPTGGYLPQGADTVVPIEQARMVSKDSVNILASLPRGAFVSPAGMDVKKGTKLFHGGSILRAQDVALLSMVGIMKVPVFNKPRVAIIPTGNELTDDPSEVKNGKILNTNSQIISRFVQGAGGLAMDLGPTPDNSEQLQKKMRAVVEETDMILTIGGSSMGEHDVVEEAINSMGSPGILVHGVKLDRGRVAGVGVIMGKPIIILPGPVQGALSAFIVLALPLLRSLSGLPEGSSMGIKCTLAERWEARKKFSNFVKVVYVRTMSSKDGNFKAFPIIGETASMTVLTRADGYVLVPKKITALEAGAQITVNLFLGPTHFR